MKLFKGLFHKKEQTVSDSKTTFSKNQILPTSQIAVTGGMTKWNKTGLYYTFGSNNSSVVDYYAYDEMINHPVLAYAMEIFISPILNADGFWDCDNVEIKNFLNEAFEKFWNDLESHIVTAYFYGNAVGEKVYEYKNGKVWLKKVIPLKPHHINILIDEYDNFAGLEQEFETRKIVIPKEKSFIYTYKKRFGDLRGISRLRAARFPYIVYKYIIELTNIYYENDADGVWISTAPEGSSMVEGRLVDNITYVNEIITSAKESRNKVITLPARPKDEAQYELKILSNEKAGANYIQYLQYLETKMLQGCLIPEIMASENERGSFARTEEIARIFSHQLDVELNNFALIRKEIADELVRWNFGEKFVGKYNWKYVSTTKKYSEIFASMANAIVQNGLAKPDFKYLSQMLGMPIVENLNNENEEIKELANNIIEKKENDTKEKKVFSCNSEKVLFSVTRIKQMDRVNFAKVKAMFDKETEITRKLKNIMADMKQDIIKKIPKLKSVDDIEKFSIEYSRQFKNVFLSEMQNIFEESFNETRNELNLKTKVPNNATIRKEQLKNIMYSNKQLNDIEFKIKDILLAAITKDTLLSDIEKQIIDCFVELEKKVELGVSVTVQEMVDDGRRIGADDPDIELATWSAYLDENTCELCRQLDGKTIRVDDPEYNIITPGNMHWNDRCVWVYTRKDDDEKPEINWTTPNKELLDKYLRR